MKAKNRQILFVTVGYPPKDIGGAEIQARLQAKYLAALGNQIEIVTQSTGFKFSKEFDGSTRVTRLPRPKKRLLGILIYGIFLAIFIFIKRKRIDVIHVHLANLQADIAVLMGNLLKIPVHVKVAAGGSVGEINRFSKVAKFTRRFGLKHASSVQAISSEIEKELIQIGVPVERIVRIPNGVELHDFNDGDETKRSEDRQLAGIDPEKVVFIYLGRLSTYKGLSTLISAWESHERIQNSILFLVGPIALDAPLVISTNDPSIRIIGSTNKPSHYLSLSDVFVLPSLGEGMSNSLLEAMSRNVPVIATKVGAASELIKDGESGLLIPKSDPVALLNAINFMIQNPEIRRDFAHCASRTIVEYGIENVARALDDNYEQICLLKI